MTDTPAAGTMQDARLIETEVLVPKPKQFVRETLVMPDRYEETGYTLAAGAKLRAKGAYYSLPSETNKYTHVFLATPVAQTGLARLDSEIEKYFGMSVVVMSLVQAFEGIGTVITSMETAGALIAARAELQAPAAYPQREHDQD